MQSWPRLHQCRSIICRIEGEKGQCNEKWLHKYHPLFSIVIKKKSSRVPFIGALFFFVFFYMIICSYLKKKKEALVMAFYHLIKLWNIARSDLCGSNL